MIGAASLALLAASALPASASGTATPEEAGDAEKSWSASASAYVYLVPHDHDFVQPTLTFDEGPLHLEARYNYEALRAFSAWVGGTLRAGDEVTFELTPMVGVVVGDAAGIAFGYRAAVGWWKLELASEGEGFLDARDSSGNFLYSWSELTIAPFEWLRFGLSAQRTRAYETDVDIHRGLVLALSYEMVDVAGYVFDIGWADPTFVIGAAITF